MKAAELIVKYLENEGVEYIFGANGYHIESADPLAPALRTALSSDRLSIIDCPVDASENLHLTLILGKLTVPTGDMI